MRAVGVLLEMNRSAEAGPRCVLVVDDDADAREMLAELVVTFGHSPVTAASAPEAVERAMESRPDLALIDIGLPGVDGFELARWLRQLFGSGTRLIALTGYSDEVTQAAAEAAGFDEYVVKPAPPDRLAALLDGKSAGARLPPSDRCSGES